MTDGALFNSGFLGASFNWWVGQIADDSTWRDNMLPGKHQTKDEVPGWGRRYKVRIIGLHDKEEETIIRKLSPDIIDMQNAFDKHRETSDAKVALANEIRIA
jgi:glutathionyl-hydroquinone reductase